MAKEYLIQGDTLTNIADKIRVLSGTEGALKLDDMAVTLETSNTNLDNELNTQSGLIDQIKSVVNELPEVSDLEPVLQEKTVTPSTSSQNVVADSGFDGLSKVTVNGDANLKAENIAEGVSIFGVAGTHSGGGASVETCTVTVSGGVSTTDTSRIYNVISYTSYQDGVISGCTLFPTTNGAQTITNVIKNSVVCIHPHNSRSDVLNNATDISSRLGNTFGAYRINGDNATIHNYSCFIYGTKILLYDKTTKEIQNISYNDELLVWDFDNACYTSAKPLWIKKSELTTQYYHCVFENGITLNLVGGRNHAHRIFCLDTNRFEYANDCINKTIMTYNGSTKLISCEIVENTVEFYNIITDYHMNLFANNVLTSTGFNNLYPVENMKFIKKYRELIPIETFDNCPKEYYYGMRLGEQVNYSVERINEKIKNIKELAI